LYASSLLGLLLVASTATGAPRHRPAAEVVVTVTAAGDVLVGLGEPPSDERLPVLVYVGTGDRALEDSLPPLREALGGSPPVRRYASRGATPDLLAAVDGALARFAAVAVDPVEGGPDPGAQMTADRGGFHRRDSPGAAAPDAQAALSQWVEVASYGHGHGQPMFELAGGGMRQVRTDGWEQATRAYACPFPATIGRSGPAGKALELGLADARTASEEALASWCERAARALTTHCDVDEIIAAFDLGVVESTYGEGPGEGLWWLAPDHVGPAGGSTMDVPCAADALISLEIAALHGGLGLRFHLIGDDLTTGCRREIVEGCQ